jgi:rhodanese-related sulfurtransferase
MRLLLIIFIFYLFSCKNNDSETPKTEVKNISELQKTTDFSQPINVGIDEAEKLLKTEQDIIVLDVRTPEETQHGVINNAMVLDFYDPQFQSEIEQLDKTNTYLVYCAAGGRSADASKIMAEKGFKKVYNLSGGYRAWKK